MRLLTYNVPKKIVERFDDETLYIVDETEELDDAIYHLEVRFYNLVLVYEDDICNCLDLLSVQDSINTAFVIVAKTVTKEFEITCLKNGALSVSQKDDCIDLLMAKIESIHRDKFSTKFKYKEYLLLDNKNQEVYDRSNNELEIRGKAYDVLSYLVQNKHRPPISKDEIVYALWEDPEMVSQNVIEVNINQIRSKLKKRFGVDFIDTVRNRGYKIVDNKNERDTLNV